MTFCASSLWALYPTRGRVELSLGSLEYGSLLAFLGLGACVSALLSDKIMLPGKTHRSLGASYVVYALGVLTIGFAGGFKLMSVGMFLAGIGWIVLATLMNMSTRQVTSKSHLKATMLGAFFTVFYAGMALGAVTWGAIARFATTSVAMSIAGVALIVIGAWKLRPYRRGVT
ncbi:enterobactin exporter EntS [compost metagenome]